MKVVLASQSPVKVDVCKQVVEKFYADVELITVKAKSGVPEQPFDHETSEGAYNRITDARTQIPDADLYISIENGIYNEKGRYIDRAVAVACDQQGDATIKWSKGVEFPALYVQEAKRLGTDQWTVGKIMQEAKVITQHDDPHKDLVGISRADLLKEVLTRTLQLHVNPKKKKVHLIL